MTEAIRNLANPPSIRDFAQAIESDAFTAAVRGFAWLEDLLDALLLNLLKDEGELNLERIPASFKISLAKALGLIKPDDASALRALLKIRNNYAHHTHYSLDQSTINDAINGLSSEYRDLLRDVDKALDESGPIRGLMAVMLACFIRLVRRGDATVQSHLYSLAVSELLVETVRGVHISGTESVEAELKDKIESRLKNLRSQNGT